MIGRFVKLTALAVVLAAAVAQSAAAQGITQKQANAILDELKQIHLLLEKNMRQEPARAANPACAPEQKAKLAAVDAYAVGREDAPLTLVEFADYECPFCRQFHISAFEQLKRTYIDTGSLRYVSRDLPLEFHNFALGAANAARCAGEQGKYWEMRQAMLVNADKLDSAAVLTYARDLGLHMPRFQLCVESEKYKPAIRRDMADAQAAGISGTPSFVLGRTSKESMEGVVIVGAQPFGNFDAKIRELLGK